MRVLDAQFPGSSATVHGALGDSNSEETFAPTEAALAPETPLSFTPNGGRSSDGHLPYFNIETPGAGVAFAIGWSGQWQAQFEKLKTDGVRASAGMQFTHFALQPGETVRTPRVLLVFWKGTDLTRGPNLVRSLTLEHYSPRRSGAVVFPPICASVSQAAPDGSYEGPHLKVMSALAARGYEVFWSDMDPQQWYPGGFPNGTGTWEPDPKLYPRGLKPIGEAAHAAGLGYLLWFEPERVAPGSRIDTDHPEWVAKPPKKGNGLFRLDLPEARAWLTDYVDKQVSDANLDWMRWDFNIEPLRFWRATDTPDRQGITEMKYIEGLYAMWDDLRARHPGLIIDNCASGGRRIDIESNRRGLPLWHSDLQCTGPHPAADQLQNGGLSRWVPLHGCAAFDFEPSYTFRSEMTTGNVICASNTVGPEFVSDKGNRTRRQTQHGALQKSPSSNAGGFLTRSCPHRAASNVWYGYQFHRADQNAGVVFLFRRETSPETEKTVALRGLAPGVTYDVQIEGESQLVKRSSDQLAALPVTIPAAPGATILFYAQTKP